MKNNLFSNRRQPETPHNQRPRAVLASITLVTALLWLGAGVISAQPVINSINPPILNEQAGDHVAFTVSATGNGALTYQWYQNGTVLTGQTNAWLALTNIQPVNSGQYGVTVEDTSEAYASNSATLNVATNYLPLAGTNLVVVRLGDGVQALSAATGNTIYLDQYTTSGGYVSTVQIPDRLPNQPYGVGTNKTVAHSTALILPGLGTDAANQGVLTLSGNQQFLTIAGYQLAYPYTSTDVTAGGAAYVRGIYTINAYGYPALAYTNYGLYSGGNHTIRSAFTLDGTNFWTTGQAGSVGGVKYVSLTNTAYATGTGIPTISSSTTGTRVVQVANGNLVFSDANASGGHGLWAATGLPEPAANAATVPTQLVLSEGGIPNDFAISPDGSTIYIADGQPFVGTSVQAGGIQRWDYSDGAGSYVYSYTLPVNAGTNGAQNLAVLFPASITTWGPGITGATLYATVASVSNNVVVTLTDNGSTSVPAPFITAGPGQVIRGLRFGPSAAAAVGIATQPQSQTAPVGNNVTFSVTAQGAPPFFYQWQLDNTNLPGATQQTLTLTNVQFSSAGNYSVIVSNPATFATSFPAALTVALGAPVITEQPQSWIENEGDHVAFSVAAAGTLPINYQWYKNSVQIAGATNAALVLTNIQPGDSASYYAKASNIYGTSNSITATLSVPTGLQTLSSNNLIVSRIGDGSQTLSAATGNTIYLDQFATNGTYVSSTQISDEGAGLPYGYGPGTNVSASVNLPPGSTPLLVAGAGPDAPYEALLTLSADRASLNFAGYVQAYPANVPDITYSQQLSAGNSTNNWRGIGGVSAYGYYSLEYTNSGLYSGGNHTIHSATTLEGVNFWTAGEAGTGGIKFVSLLDPSYATGIDIPYIASSGPGTRIVQIVNGNVVFSDANASPPGIYGTSGTPELAKSGTATSSLLINEGGSPVDFAVSPDGNTVYISDDQAFGGANVQAGGIQRWDSNGAGGYNYSYTLSPGTNGVGARGLTAYFPTSITAWGPGVTGALLYATTAESPSNRVISVTDNGAGSTATTLSVSGANQVYAGIRFGPSVVPVGLYNSPQSTNVFAGQTVTLSAAPTGSAPYEYQWLLDNTNIVGATNATLTLSDLQSNEAGSYSLVVSNGVNSVTSTAAQVTIVAQPQFTSSTNLAGGQGFQLSFTGPAGYNYSIWTTTNVASAPIKNTWTQLTSGGAFSGGTDTYIDPNGGTNSGQFYIITVP